MGSSSLLKGLLLLGFAVVTLGNSDTSSGLRAFYLVQQWLGSYCNQAGEECCYPPTGKPSPDFTIDGLWPYFNDGNFAYNCGNGNYDVARLKPLELSLRKAWPSFICPQIGRKFWVHEWNKHGTCTKTILGEMAYFKAALNLKNKMNIFEALTRAGIKPNNQFYSLKAIRKAIVQAIGFHPLIMCNHDAHGNNQIWQVALCADTTGTKLIECPYLPKGRGNCLANIKFPSYYQ